MLRAEHLTVRVRADDRAGDRALLDDLTLTFAPGELTAVVGPNGAGKTTLLRCLDGELAPSAGRVELAGRALGDWPRMELARARAVLPQQSTLDFPFSALDVALLGRIPHFGGGGGRGGAGNAADRAIAMRALALCDCAGLEERAYPSLSGGEKQRVQTARALAQLFNAGDGGGDVGGDGDGGAGDGDGDAGDGAGGDGAGDGRGGDDTGDGADGDGVGGDSIGDANNAGDTRFLLLDEPVSALDLRHQYQLLGLLKSLSRDGLGVVCTLHNLNLVAQFADRAIIIDRGMLVADGAPLEVFTEETIGHVFDLEVRIRPHPDDPQVPLLIPRLPSAAVNAG